MPEQDSEGNEVHRIEIGSDWKKPLTDEPVFGEKRLVRLVPTPLGAREAIWTSSTSHIGANGKRCKNVLLLISREPLHTMAAEINEDSLKDLPLVPCEW